MQMLKKLFAIPPQNRAQSMALLLFRLIVGSAFIIHGLEKIRHPAPGHLPFLTAISEFAGGFSLILGLFFQLAMFELAIIMFIAIVFHMIEPALGYLGIAIMFLAMGPGAISLDKLFFGERTALPHKNTSETH